MHGGATPRGTDSPHFKHGLYSRYARGELAARIAELREQEELLHDLREVLAVQGALLGEALRQGDLGAAAALTEAVSRSIDRYHKHAPATGSVIEYHSAIPWGAGASVEEIDRQIDDLLRLRQEEDATQMHPRIHLAKKRPRSVRDPGTLVIVDRDGPGDPTHGTGDGNP